MTRIVETTTRSEPLNTATQGIETELDSNEKNAAEIDNCVELNLDEYFLYRDDRIIENGTISSARNAMACT